MKNSKKEMKKSACHMMRNSQSKSKLLMQKLLKRIDKHRLLLKLLLLRAACHPCQRYAVLCAVLAQCMRKLTSAVAITLLLSRLIH